MAEQALYPAVALGYFALLSWESRKENLLLGTAASVNVFCLFVLAQPLCLAIGGYYGAGIYLVMSISSYLALPRVGGKEKEKAKGQKKNEAEEDNVKGSKSSGKRKMVEDVQKNGLQGAGESRKGKNGVKNGGEKKEA